MRNSFLRDGKKPELLLSIAYFSCALMLASDCIWTSVTYFGGVSAFFGYLINLLYFYSSSLACVCWFFFCAKVLEFSFSHNIFMRLCSLGPYMVLAALYAVSPWKGLVFSIENGEYIRGALFFLDPSIKMGYVCAASAMALIRGKSRQQFYLKKKDYSLIAYSVPIIICGILQSVTGCDFNCLGCALALILTYVMGVSNSDAENVDIVYSLATAFDAAYIVNVDTQTVRALHSDRIHSAEFPEVLSDDYKTHFIGVLNKIVLPDERDEVINNFHIENVQERFNNERAFSIRYRVHEPSGLISLHSATFINAPGRDGKQEFLLGITKMLPENMLYERNEALSLENQRLEQVNRSILQSVAKIVSERDLESGEHIIRLQKLTEVLARDVMEHNPEYGLNEEAIELIASASVLHDIGKIVIPDSILLKPGKLTKEEFEIMKTHTVKGCEVLNRFPLGLDDAFLGYANSICRWHHEKYDGAGYPDGLVGEQIPIAAQIVSIADCFDALVNERKYKEVFSIDVAEKMILNGECGAFSPKLLESFVRVQSQLKKFSAKNEYDTAQR